MSILPALSSFAMTYFTIAGDSTQLGVPHVNLVSFSCILGFGLLLYALSLLWQKCCGGPVEAGEDHKPLLAFDGNIVNETGGDGLVV